MCFIKYAEEVFLEENEPFSKCKSLIYRKYSIQKFTDISQDNNLLDAPASMTDAFLWRATCVSTQLNMPIWNKKSLSPVENAKLQEVFLSKTNSILTVKPCARCSCF
jgi:hypothetical protein